MGQWVEKHKRIVGITQVKDITIRATDNGKLLVTFSHKDFKKSFTKVVDKADITLREMSLGKFVSELNANVTIAEWWGDWGGPIHYKDSLFINIKQKGGKRK